jgi:hypothetical protein
MKHHTKATADLMVVAGRDFSRYGFSVNMNAERLSASCKICGAPTRDDSEFCGECESAFEPAVSGESGGERRVLDLERYGYRTFPWDQNGNLPGLITSNAAWVFLAIALVLIVLLLALVRAPLPSCWEISEKNSGQWLVASG